MTDTTTATATPPIRERALPSSGAKQLILLVAVVTAFHATLYSILRQVLEGEPLTYLLLTPMWAAIVTVGTQRRRRAGLDIHDRQTDWLVAGGLGILLAMLVYLLAPRLGTTAGLVRLDVLELLLFGTLGSVLLFGTRTTTSHWAGAGFVFACAPLVYRFTGAALGGTPADFAVINVVLSAVATGIGAPGGRPRRVATASVAAVVGAVGVGAMHGGPPALGQLLPAALGPAIALLTVGRLRVVGPASWFRGASGPPTVKHPARGVAVIVLSAVALGTFPQLVPDHLRSTELATVDYRADTGLIAPDFWSAGESTTEAWVPRYFGTGAQLRRTAYSSTAPQRVVAPGADPNVVVVPGTADVPRIVPQQVVVDVLSADKLDPFNVFPALVCYQIRSLYLRAGAAVPLGHGVTASLYFANGYAAYNPVQSQWMLLSWTWKVRTPAGERFQRVAVLTLDGEPQPRGIPNLADPRGNSTVLTTFTAILRGVAATASLPPGQEAVQRLQDFARELVDNQSNYRPA